MDLDTGVWEIWIDDLDGELAMDQNERSINKIEVVEKSVFDRLATKMKNLISFLEEEYVDNHYWSHRPCATCDKASAGTGIDIGCTRFRKDPKWAKR